VLTKIKIAVPAAVATLALAASPAAAMPGADGVVPGKPDKPAKPDKPGKGPKGVAYVFKGTYIGDGTVAVTKTNKHARDFKGQTVAFDFTSTKVSAGDTNADGIVDLTDVAAGDQVVVKAKLPKSEPPVQPIAAKHLVDQTNPGADGDDGEGEKPEKPDKPKPPKPA